MLKREISEGDIYRLYTNPIVKRLMTILQIIIALFSSSVLLSYNINEIIKRYKNVRQNIRQNNR